MILAMRRFAEDPAHLSGSGREHVPRSGAVLLIGERLSTDDCRAIEALLGRPVTVPAVLAEVREALAHGHVVGLAVTSARDHTDQLQDGDGFGDRYRWVTAEFPSPVVPVHVERRRGEADGVRVVHFGATLPPGASSDDVRLTQLELAAAIAAREASDTETLADRFVQTAKQRWDAPCIADSTGRNLTFGRTLVAGLLLAQYVL